MERFTLREGGTGKWVVTDNKTDPYEDATTYTFSSKKKTVAFKDMMIAEHGNA